MSGNLDAPEGGFDAIMQVVACKVRSLLLRFLYNKQCCHRHCHRHWPN